jgi:hypothetical protein
MREETVYCWGWTRETLKQEIPWHTEYFLIQGENKRRIRDIIEDQMECVVCESYLNLGGFHQRWEKNGLTRHYIVLFTDWKADGRDMGILAHEVLHLAFSVFKENNYPIPSNYHANDEEMFNDFFQLWMHRFVDALQGEDRNKHIFLFDDERNHLAEKVNEQANRNRPLKPHPRGSTATDLGQVSRDRSYASGEESKVWQQRLNPPRRVFQRFDSPAADRSSS